MTKSKTTSRQPRVYKQESKSIYGPRTHATVSWFFFLSLSFLPFKNFIASNKQPNLIITRNGFDIIVN